MNPPEDPTPETDPRLAVALARAERRREMLERLADMGMALAAEINARFIEGPHRAEPRPEPSRAFAAVSRAVRLTLILEAKIEKQILAWRKGDLASLELEPEPFLKPWIDSPESRRERVREAVSAVIDREAGDPDEAGRMRERAHRTLNDTDLTRDYRLQGDFRACVETICSDLDLEPDWTLWDDEAGFAAECAAPAPLPPAEAGEVARRAQRGETEGAQGRYNGRPVHRPRAPSIPGSSPGQAASRSPSPVVARATEEERKPYPRE